MVNKGKRGVCTVCGKYILLRKDGTVRVHGGRWFEVHCEGTGKEPRS